MIAIIVLDIVVQLRAFVVANVTAVVLIAIIVLDLVVLLGALVVANVTAVVLIAIIVLDIVVLLGAFLQMLFIFMLCLCLLTHSLFISFFLICIMHSAFNLFVFHNSMFTPLLLFVFVFLIFFNERAMSSPEK